MLTIERTYQFIIRQYGSCAGWCTCKNIITNLQSKIFNLIAVRSHIWGVDIGCVQIKKVYINMKNYNVWTFIICIKMTLSKLLAQKLDTNFFSFISCFFYVSYLPQFFPLLKKNASRDRQQLQSTNRNRSQDSDAIRSMMIKLDFKWHW